jgi:hypothetical protein
MKKVLLILSAAVFPAIANAANQVFMFSGTTQSVSTTLTNPYSLAAVAVSGMYNVNNSTYAGQGTGNTLLMTNASDFITLDSGGMPNVQTVSDVQRIVTGNGNDIVDMASSNFTLGDLDIYGGVGNDLIWGNAGNDTFNINIDSTGESTIDGGPGVDTVVFSAPRSSYTITRTGSLSYTIATLDDSDIVYLSNVESAQFTDQTVDLTPEPSSLCLMVAGIAGLGMRRRRRRNASNFA